MKPTSQKKLSMKRITLANLTAAHLATAVGGLPRYTKYSVCAGTGGGCHTDVNASCRTQNY